MGLLTKHFSIEAIVWYDFKVSGNILYLHSNQRDNSICTFLKSMGSINCCKVSQLHI